MDDFAGLGERSHPAQTAILHLSLILDSLTVQLLNYGFISVVIAGTWFGFGKHLQLTALQGVDPLKKVFQVSQLYSRWRGGPSLSLCTETSRIFSVC